MKAEFSKNLPNHIIVLEAENEQEEARLRSWHNCIATASFEMNRIQVGDPPTLTLVKEKV